MPAMTPSSSWEISRILAYKNVTFLRDYDVITMGIPPQIRETPQKMQFQPISSRNVHSNNQNQCNDTCFV